MSPPPPKMKKTSVVTPRKTMRGHTDDVYGVAHLPDGKRTITCSYDSSLRLWDIESGEQIGEEWRDEGDKSGIRAMALSPNGKNIASGSLDGTVRLWDVETGKIVHKWKAHPFWVKSVCWSPNGERVVSGSNDGTTRVWDANSGEPVQGLNPMKVREWVTAVRYSPGAKMIATGGQLNEIEIWDAKTGKRFTTIELDEEVHSLAWTSDENKLIAGLHASIRIFDTATWQQIADWPVDSHPGSGREVYSLTLFQNDRLLASTSLGGRARLWNLDTNRQVGPPLQHDNYVYCAAFSVDGKLLTTGTGGRHRPYNAYVWDIYAILKAAGLEDLLSDANAARRPPIRSTPRRVPQGFFDDVQDHHPSSATRRLHPDPSPHRRRHPLTLSWGSRPRALLARLPQLFRRSQSNADEPIELPQRPLGPGTSSRRSPPVVQVPALDDKKALYVAWRPKPASHNVNAERIKNSKWWARVVLFICCVSPSTDGGH